LKVPIPEYSIEPDLPARPASTAATPRGVRKSRPLDRFAPLPKITACAGTNAIDRRRFLQHAGAVSAAGLAVADVASAKQPPPAAGTSDRQELTWLFWDLWRFDRVTNLKHRQAEARLRPEATFADPLMFGHNSWPTVYFDKAAGLWRMLYSIDWKPYTLMLAESDDGIRWKPAPQPQVTPPGKKQAPHHLFTLAGGGGVYLDPIADDGFPFKVYVHQ